MVFCCCLKNGVAFHFWKMKIIWFVVWIFIFDASIKMWVRNKWLVFCVYVSEKVSEWAEINLVLILSTKKEREIAFIVFIYKCASWFFFSCDFIFWIFCPLILKIDFQTLFSCLKPIFLFLYSWFSFSIFVLFLTFHFNLNFLFCFCFYCLFEFLFNAY